MLKDVDHEAGIGAPGKSAIASIGADIGISPRDNALLRFPYKKPYVTSQEHVALSDVLAGRHFSSSGPYTKRCETLLVEQTGALTAHLVQSCSAGLELAMTLANVGPGDEVIMPSFNFVSAANAVVMRGATPVFVDIRPDTLNIDERLVEAAIGPATRAIVCVAYGGVSAEMDALAEVAATRNLLVVNDAAHGFLSTYNGQAVAGTGDIAVFSFHDTKDITCGEGGAVLINRADLVERGDIIAEKGTNRKAFSEGRADFYTWVDVGQSAKPSEFTASILWAQLQHANEIRRMRMDAWRAYHAALEPLERAGVARRPFVPQHCGINGHNYFLILQDTVDRSAVINALLRRGIEAMFHFVPLHSSPAGRRYGRTVGLMTNTDVASSGILRLPLWPGIAPHCSEIATDLTDILLG